MPDARLLAAFPETTRFCRVYEQEIDAPDMDLLRSRVHTAAVRKDIVLRATKAGELKCAISFRIHLDRKGDLRQAAPDVPLTPKERTAYLANAKGMTANSTTAREMVNRLHDDHPGTQELVDRIFQECREWIEPVGDVGLDSGDEALVQRKGSQLGLARAFATLCRAAKVPARLVTGFEIKKADKTRGRSPFSRERGSKPMSPIRKSRPSDIGCRTIRRTAPCTSWTTTSSPCGATTST